MSTIKSFGREAANSLLLTIDYLLFRWGFGGKCFDSECGGKEDLTRRLIIVIT